MSVPPSSFFGAHDSFFGFSSAALSPHVVERRSVALIAGGRRIYDLRCLKSLVDIAVAARKIRATAKAGSQKKKKDIIRSINFQGIFWEQNTGLCKGRRRKIRGAEMARV